MKHLIICGTGAFAREMYWHSKESLGYGVEWDLKGYLEGPVPKAREEYKKLQLPVLGDYNNYQIEDDDVFACGVGTPKIRKDFIQVINNKGGQFINVIHKTHISAGNVKLGKGIILCPFTYANDNVLLGDYVVMNMMAGVGHDVQLGAYSCLMGHVELCGFVKVGTEAYFGSGARVLPNVIIGDNAFIGSGSVVLTKVKADAKVFGNPARVTDL